MIKRILLALALVASAAAQISVVGNQVDHGPTLPTTCNVGQVYFLTVMQGMSSPGLYQCATANTWTSGSGGGGNLSGTLTTTKIPVATGAHALSDSTVSDDGADPVASPDGLGTGSAGGLTYDMPNEGATGTALHKMACQASGAYTAKTCSHLVTTGAIGVATAGVGTAPGTTGNVSLCYGGNCTVLFDNQTTAGHYAIFSPTIDGELHDTGSTSETQGVDNFLVDSANSGADTTATIKLLSPDQIGASVAGKISGTLPIKVTQSTPGSATISTQHTVTTAFGSLTSATALYGGSGYTATFPANFSGTNAVSTVTCKTNPSGTITFTLKDETASATLGTIAVNSSCAGTFATTGGTTKTLTASDVLSMTPSGTDGSAIGVVIILYTN